ncbi:hypothetical protein L9F63_002594, partial [Diploptera punctata]
NSSPIYFCLVLLNLRVYQLISFITQLEDKIIGYIPRNRTQVEWQHCCRSETRR